LSSSEAWIHKLAAGQETPQNSRHQNGDKNREPY